MLLRERARECESEGEGDGDEGENQTDETARKMSRWNQRFLK